MERTLSHLALAALALLPSSYARADYISFSYVYGRGLYAPDFDPSVTTVSLEPRSHTSASGQVEPGSGPLALAPLRLRTHSGPPASLLPPGEINNFSGVEILVRDQESGELASFYFSGMPSGLVGRDSSTMMLSYTAYDTMEAALGGNVYRVWLPDVAVPPWSGGSVEFSPLLTVRAASVAEQAPEPSTLALGAAAALGLAARRWVRRRAGTA